MNLVHQTMFGAAYWPIMLAAALLLVGVWLGHRAQQRNLHTGEQGSANATRSNDLGLVYTDAPTIRLGDTQRIDRLHRVVVLKAGEHADLLDLTFDRIPRLRIVFAGFEQECARIHIELGGAIAGCGSLVKELAPNQFLVPCATGDEHHHSILHFQGKDDVVSVLRVKVLHFNPQQNAIDVDVLHVCGNWSA